MKLVAIFLVSLGCFHRSRVRFNRLFPVTDAREDVRRHVLRMRRGRRDLGVLVGGSQALRGDRRIVIEMDQIVSDARMLWLPLPERFKDGGALERLCIGLVAG